MATSSRPSSARSYQVGTVPTQSNVSRNVNAETSFGSQTFQTSQLPSVQTNTPRAHSPENHQVHSTRSKHYIYGQHGPEQSSISRANINTSTTIAQQQEIKRPNTGNAETRTNANSATRRPKSRSGFMMGGVRKPPKKRTVSAYTNRPQSRTGHASNRPATPQAMSSPANDPSTSDHPLEESIDDRPLSRQKLIRQESRPSMYKQKSDLKIVQGRVAPHLLPGICLAMIGFMFFVAGIMMISITSTDQDKASIGLKASGPILVVIGLGLIFGGFIYKYVMHRKYKKQLELDKKLKKNKDISIVSQIEDRCTSPNFTDQVTIGIENEIAQEQNESLPGFSNQAYTSSSPTTPSRRKNVFLASSFSDISRGEDTASLSSEKSISIPSELGDSYRSRDNSRCAENNTPQFNEHTGLSTVDASAIPNGDIGNHSITNYISVDTDNSAKPVKNKGNKNQIKNFRRRNVDTTIMTNNDSLHTTKELNGTNGVLKPTNSKHYIHNILDNEVVAKNQGDNSMTFNMTNGVSDKNDPDISTVDTHITIERKVSS